MAIRSHGATISVATNNIGGFLNHSMSGSTAPEIKTTTQADDADTFVGGIPDYGTLEITGQFLVADAGQTYLRSNLGATAAFVVTYSDGTTDSFSGVISSYDKDNPEDDVVGFTSSIKISGEVTTTAA